MYKNLTDNQANGLACVVCGLDFDDLSEVSVPVGLFMGAQVFACVECKGGTR